MTPCCDYHMHTPLCGHAAGEPQEYAEQAIRVGLREIGFSDHAPFVVRNLPGITMAKDELPTYYKMIEDVRDAFKGELTVKIGIEADFIPGYEDKTKALLDDYPYDYVIGSVHFINNWGFDDPEEREQWKQKDITQVYKEYHNLLRQSAKSGLYDIMGHVDLVKKFGHRPGNDIYDDVKDTAQTFKECGVAIEINTSGLRKPVEEIYPAKDLLQIYHDAGVPITFGSDSHQPQHVGQDFDLALQLAQDVGYSEYVFFKDRKIERVEKL